MDRLDTARLAWQKVGGLIPAVVQDVDSGKVLMVAMMSPESLAQTLATGQVTFFSRSRQALWTKGETSGHFLHLVAIKADCDGDCLLVTAKPSGPTCHTGAESCFDLKPMDQDAGVSPGVRLELEAESGATWTLDDLWKIIERRAEASEGHGAETSYTAKLLRAGVDRCAQKVGEEGVEVALASVSGDSQRIVSEAADLIYHLFVLLKACGSSPEKVRVELSRRHEHASKCPS